MILPGITNHLHEMQAEFFPVFVFSSVYAICVILVPISGSI